MYGAASASGLPVNYYLLKKKLIGIFFFYLRKKIKINQKCRPETQLNQLRDNYKT